MTVPLTARSVLVANRGEIACRVFRTARRLGLRTIALFTEGDAGAPHVREADEAVRVPSYLDIEAVVRAAQGAGADLVHPGYGFLSERAAFAMALADSGITLVGPSTKVMELMGRKDAARDVALAAGVPVVPSYSFNDDPAAFTYPVLVKAAAGGGGKGMRVVHRAADLPAAVDAARRESASAFGDDTLLLERFVETGRHIEVQVMADTHGTTLHLGERDCSTQRRHQKVLEESPAPTLSQQVREKLHRAAVDLAREVGYVGAGTVEFLLDSATDEFYFLEMNTRLQVEHPVTEAVTGLDLVELQLLVADGQALAVSQADISVTGHAIEARVYAEDAYGGFLPQAGVAQTVIWPHGQARVDHALESGQRVSTAFDPMLGKVIVHAADRERARLALIAALDETAILGLTTNTGFLRELLATEEFRDAAIDTAWLDHHHVHAPGPDPARDLAAWVLATTNTGSSPFSPDGFRVAATPAPIRCQLDQTVVVDPTEQKVDGLHITPLANETRSDDVTRLVVDLETTGRTTAFVRPLPRGAEVCWRGGRFVLVQEDRAAAGGATSTDGTVTSPMPATVLQVRVQPGDRVGVDDVLGVVEAMKMELSLSAPTAGVVAQVRAQPGDQVELGAVLFEITADDSQDPGHNDVAGGQGG